MHGRGGGCGTERSLEEKKKGKEGDAKVVGGVGKESCRGLWEKGWKE